MVVDVLTFFGDHFWASRALSTCAQSRAPRTMGRVSRYKKAKACDPFTKKTNEKEVVGVLDRTTSKRKKRAEKRLVHRDQAPRGKRGDEADSSEDESNAQRKARERRWANQYARELTAELECMHQQ